MQRLHLDIKIKQKLEQQDKQKSHKLYNKFSEIVNIRDKYLNIQTYLIIIRKTSDIWFKSNRITFVQYNIIKL